MKFSKLLRKLPLFMAVFTIALTASPVLSKDHGNGKAKGKEKGEQMKKRGREAGELPNGLEQIFEKKGEYPKGLQKKTADGGSLPRGLLEGGKRAKSSGKGKKDAK